MTDPRDDNPNPENAASESGGGSELDVYRQVFVEETREELDSLVEALLTLENDPGNDSAVNDAFRYVHSMKGSSAMMGFSNAGELAHVWEDLLDQFRSGGLTLAKSHVDLMLRCVDAFRDFVESLAASTEVTDADPSATASLVDSLRAAVSEQAPSVDDPAVEAPVEQPAPASRAPLATGVFNNLELTAKFDPQLQLPDLKARLIASRLADVSEIVHVTPDFDETEKFESDRQLQITLMTQLGVEEIREKASVDGVASIDIRQLSGVGYPVSAAVSDAPPEADQTVAAIESAVETAETPVDPAAAEEAGKPTGAAAQAPETIRVEIQRLDQLMNLTGELVVSQERFRELAQVMGSHFRQKGVSDRMTDAALTLETESGGRNGNAVAQGLSRDHAADLRNYAGLWDDATQSHRALDDAVDQLSRISDDLQRAVMETRMVPLAPLFNRFKRVVRDLASGAGKEVQLKIRGEKTELDKRMIDELADPLIHLVRNAIDHGLETPAEREQAGKPAAATITLSAVHRGNNVYISVADDGRGLNVDRIRERIIERNILAEPLARDLGDDQVVEYIWHPGFSTAASVTDISGRGVGMDIVRNRINALCGAIEFDFEPGQGTTFTMRLPLTLAIIPSLMLRIEPGSFSVPLEEVREITRIAPDRIVSVHGRRAIELRGEFVPVIRLNDCFRWNSVSPRSDRVAEDSQREDGMLEVVVLRVTGQSVGLEIDAPLGVSELVVKSLADNFQDVRGLSGASILGSGDISLMLDTSALAEMAQPRDRVAREATE